MPQKHVEAPPTAYPTEWTLANTGQTDFQKPRGLFLKSKKGREIILKIKRQKRQ